MEALDFVNQPGIEVVTLIPSKDSQSNWIDVWYKDEIASVLLFEEFRNFAEMATFMQQKNIKEFSFSYNTDSPQAPYKLVYKIEQDGLLEAIYEGSKEWENKFETCKLILEKVVKGLDHRNMDSEQRQALFTAREFLKNENDL